MKKGYFFLCLRNLGPTQMPCHSLSGYSPAIGMNVCTHNTQIHTQTPTHVCVHRYVYVYIPLCTRAQVHPQPDTNADVHIHARTPPRPAKGAAA